MASQTVENYLKCIYALELVSDKGVSTNAIAERLETQAPSVTDMLKKLKQRGLISYKKYQGANLTDEGRSLAIAIVRRHRLWEVFLVDKLGFKWDEVHAIAEELEHVQSQELTDRLDRFLGSPKLDPHGDPIPDADGNWQVLHTRVALDELGHGESGVFVGVNDSSSAFLQYLDSVKLSLGARLKVLDRLPFDQSLRVESAQGERQISQIAAKNLLVRKVE